MNGNLFLSLKKIFLVFVPLKGALNRVLFIGGDTEAWRKNYLSG